MFRIFVFLMVMCTAAQAQDAPMTVERMAQIVADLDPDATVTASGFELVLEDIPILIVVAPGADRMRAMVPIAGIEDVSPEEMLRMMQANFDTSLDGRYAVAQGRVWGVYIHPLASLEREQFLSGIAQTVNLARTYGSLYTGGANVFGQGDSAQIYQELFEDLIGRGQDI